MMTDPAHEAAVQALTDVLEATPGVGDPLAAAEALCNAFYPRFRQWPLMPFRDLLIVLRLAEPTVIPEGGM